MSNYTITTNFGAKDSLPSGNAGKVIKGSEFTTEFTSIQTAIATKADIAGSANISVDRGSSSVYLTLTGANPEIILNDSTNTNTCNIQNTDGSIDYKADENNQFGNSRHRFYTDGTQRMEIEANGNVGIGTTSPVGDLTIGRNGNASGGNIMLGSATNATNKYGVITSQSYNSTTDTEGFAAIATQGISGTNLVAIGGGIGEVDSATQVRLYTSSATGTRTGTERMRIDSSGNVLVGTPTQFGTDGISLNQSGWFYVRRTSDKAATFRLDGDDGNIITFDKAGSTVGSIGTVSGDVRIGGSDDNHAGIRFAASTKSIIPVKNTDGDLSDNTTDLGASNSRFKDLYRSGSTYSTSDRNKKQDIRDLTDAEARVATVAKGSLKAFRYIDSVEAEGDEANIHFGIIAQDLKTAFEAEGLNANDYQVFKTSTYTDDDGVEQTTYSICYENLLAFIIAAI